MRLSISGSSATGAASLAQPEVARGIKASSNANFFQATKRFSVHAVALMRRQRTLMMEIKAPDSSLFQFLNQRQNFCFKCFHCYWPDLLVSDYSVLVDDISFRNAVDAILYALSCLPDHGR